MNWEAVGAVGESLGAIGVIVSLVYLASQIRTQNRASRVSAATEWTNQWNLFLGSFAEHSELSEIWMKGTSDFSSLNPVETVQLSSHLGRIFRVGENIYDQHEQGLFDTKAWRGVAWRERWRMSHDFREQKLGGQLGAIGTATSSSPWFNRGWIQQSLRECTRTVFRRRTEKRPKSHGGAKEACGSSFDCKGAAVNLWIGHIQNTRGTFYV